MTVFLAVLLMISYLGITAAFGWFVLAPVLEWMGQKVQNLSIKGAEYHAMVQAYKASGEVQDRST